ncbi:hypothetical protein [Arthrobacter sp. YAF16]|uniref:hypothetical protein n=1 Tax=Arthrobacter sp. YAF16 TaxID=3233076 RepID=UPI003F8F7F40
MRVAGGGASQQCAGQHVARHDVGLRYRERLADGGIIVSLEQFRTQLHDDGPGGLEVVHDAGRDPDV